MSFDLCVGRRLPGGIFEAAGAAVEPAGPRARRGKFRVPGSLR